MATEENTDAETIRAMIEFENELINNRVSWLMTFHGLLFVVLGFVWDKQDAYTLVVVLSILGILVSLMCLNTLVAATQAMFTLYDWWENNKPSGYRGPNVVGCAPPSHRWLSYLSPWNWFPVLLAAAWGFIWYLK